MELQRVLSMNKGEGENSYAKNSQVQSDIISIIKPLTEKAILDYFTTSSSNNNAIIGIADLGCSSGPNTWKPVTNIIDAVYTATGEGPQEFVVYLNDLPSNDFNAVIGDLPMFHKKLKDDKGQRFVPCHVMCVAGTFHGRLFPSRSLHFVHSSSSLHWLSKVPSSLDSTSIPRLNKGKINISKNSPQAVLDAYSCQFKEDFYSFLRSRSTEVVPRGRMVLTLMGRRLTDPTTEEDTYLHWDLLADALMTFVSKDLLEEDKVDSFNMPYYAASPEELREAVEREGSFKIDQLGAFDFRWEGGAICHGDGSSDTNLKKGADVLARVDKITKVHRAIVEGMFEHHFGREIMNELFNTYNKMLEAHFHRREPMFTNVTISLIRNMV